LNNILNFGIIIPITDDIRKNSPQLNSSYEKKISLLYLTTNLFREQELVYYKCKFAVLILCNQ